MPSEKMLVLIVAVSAEVQLKEAWKRAGPSGHSRAQSGDVSGVPSGHFESRVRVSVACAGVMLVTTKSMALDHDSHDSRWSAGHLSCNGWPC